MMCLDWTEELASGIDKIDGQHRLIIKKTGELLAACKNGIGKQEATEMAEYLADYCTEHFDAEEKFMADNIYPYFLSHAKEHRAFKNFISKMNDEIKKTGTESDTVIRLVRTLVGWIIDHIRKTDLKAFEYIRNFGMGVEFSGKEIA